MADNTARAATRLSATAGHPVYSALLPIPILCFIGALITDLAYLSSPEIMWLDFSTWLLLAGLVVGGCAGVVLIIDLLRAGRGRTRALLLHSGLLFAAWLVEVLNSFVHARDGWTAVAGTGLVLSILAVLLSLAAGWFWQLAASTSGGDGQ